MSTYIELHRGKEKILVNMDLVREVREENDRCMLYYEYDAQADYVVESSVDESLRSINAKLKFAKKNTQAKGFITVYEADFGHENAIAISNIAGMHEITNNRNGKTLKGTRIYLNTSLDYANGTEYIDTYWSMPEIMTKIANAQ